MTVVVNVIGCFQLSRSTKFVRKYIVDRKEIDWVLPTMIAVIAIMFYVAALYNLSEVKKERNVALTVASQLSMAHERYLLEKYKETHCGIVEPSIPSYGEKKRLTQKEETCILGVKQIVQSDMAKLREVKK